MVCSWRPFSRFVAPKPIPRIWSSARARTGRVWTFSRQTNGVALTELWRDEAGREQCLGIFPGRSGRLGKTETGRIVYQSPAADIARAGRCFESGNHGRARPI